MIEGICAIKKRYIFKESSIFLLLLQKILHQECFRHTNRALRYATVVR